MALKERPQNATDLPRALKILHTMDRTGLSQGFSIYDARALLAHIAELERRPAASVLVESRGAAARSQQDKP